MILTDEGGRPIPKPSRKEFGSVIEYIRAVHAYNDRITNLANKAFAETFSKEIRRV